LGKIAFPTGSLVFHHSRGIGIVTRSSRSEEGVPVAYFESTDFNLARRGLLKQPTLSELCAMDKRLYDEATAAFNLVKLPTNRTRLAAMQIFLSQPYNVLMSVVVMVNTAILSIFHFRFDVFEQSYLSTLVASCAGVLPLPDSLAINLANHSDAAGCGYAWCDPEGSEDMLNYTDMWLWRRSLQSLLSTNTSFSPRCNDFLLRGLTRDVPAIPDSLRTLVMLNNYASAFIFGLDALLGMCSSVTFQYQAYERAAVDAALSIITIIGLFVPPLSSFAIFRLFTTSFRVVTIPSLNRVLRGLGDTVSSLVPLCLLLGGFILFFSILGMVRALPARAAVHIRARRRART
jgi:hypothetical protein